MKCYAAAVIYSKKENRLMTEYGMWMLEWCDTVIGVALHDEFGFGGKRLQRFYDNSRHTLTSMVTDYTPERMFEDNGKGRVKADERARITDGIETAQSVIDRELRAFGLADWQCKQLVPEDAFDEAKIFRERKARVLSHAARKAWYEVNGRRTLKMYVGSILLYLHSESGFGINRAEKLYARIAPQIRGYIADFLMADMRIDQQMKKQLDNMHAILQEKGIEMVEMPDEDTVMIRAGAQAKPIQAASIENIAEYNKIMQDVKKANMRRVLE